MNQSIKPAPQVKRVGTPLVPKNQSPVINSRKIVDASNNGLTKKIQGNPFQTNQTKLREEQIQLAQKPIPFFGEKQMTNNQGHLNFDPFSYKMNNHHQMPNQFQSRIQPPQHQAQQQQQTLMNHQPFGFPDSERRDNFPQHSSPQYPKKGENICKEEFISHEVYKELLNKFETLSYRFDEMKQVRSKLVETHKQKDEAIKQLEDMMKQKDETIKLLKIENGICKKRSQDIIRQNKLLKEQIAALQSEERKDNHDQMMEMMIALRLHQQEEHQLQMAMQQSAEDVQSNPNFINVDSMTYEELLQLEEKNGKVCRGLPDEIIDSLPIIQFNLKLKGQQDRCTICMADFEIEEEVKQLPCRHFYHAECVDNWLKQEKKCPVCKGEIDSNERE